MRTCSTPACSSAGGSIVGACPPEASCYFTSRPCGSCYRGYVVTAVGLLVVQGGLIGVLLVQRAQRRRAQRSLAERLRFETLLSDLSAVLSSCPDRRGRPARRGRAPAHRRGPEGGPGHHLGDGGSYRRGPTHAFVDPRGRSGSPDGCPGERGASDLLAAPAGACHPPPAAWRLARRSSDPPPEPRAVRHAVERRGPPHRGQRGWWAGSRSVPFSRNAAGPTT